MEFLKEQFTVSLPCSVYHPESFDDQNADETQQRLMTRLLE